jgi:inhibitor of cysteine peptidase
MFRLLKLLMVLAGVLLLATCAAPGAASVRLSERDSGRTVELRVRDRLEIVLEGNPTTGYQWEQIAGEGSILRPAGAPDFRPDSSAPGAGGAMTLPFEAAGAGKTTLKLIYHRSFEPNVPPLKTFEANIVVQ